MPSRSVRCASRDTAIRPTILSRLAPTTGRAACIQRERSVAVWNVATTGVSAAQSASSEMVGVIGSWMWTRSKCPDSTHRDTRAAVIGPKLMRATDPL